MSASSEERIQDLLYGFGMALPEFDQVAEMYYTYREGDVTHSKEEARFVALVAVELHLVEQRARRAPRTIDSSRLIEFDDDPLEKRLKVRKYNQHLDMLWSEYTALHPERTSFTDEEMTAVALQAWKLSFGIKTRRIA